MRSTNDSRPERPLRQFLENAPEGFAWVDAHEVIQWANETLARLLGVTRAELEGHSWREFVSESSHPRADEIWAALRREQSVMQEFLYLRLPSRHALPGRVSASPHLDGGHFAGAHFVVRDASFEEGESDARTRIAKQLSLAERLGRCGSWDFDADNHRTRVSNGYREVLGLPPTADPPTRADFLSRVHPDDRDRMNLGIEDSLRPGGAPPRRQFRVVDPDGHIRHVQTMGEIDRNPDGSVRRIVGLIRDVTAELESHQALYERAELLDLVHSAVITTDVDLMIRTWNRGAEREYGYTKDEIVGKSLSLLFENGVVPIDGPAMLERLEGREHVEFEQEHRTKDGRSIIMFGACSELRDKDGNVSGFVGTLRNVTERAQMHALQRKRERLLSEAERVARTGSWDWDLVEDSVDGSLQTRRLFGLEDGEDALSSDVFLGRIHPEDEERVRRHISDVLEARETRFRQSFRVFHQDSILHLLTEAQVEFSSDGVPLRMIGVTRDVTEEIRQDAERRRLEDELQVRHKMDSLGRLAGGVAHDFNNLLSSILGNAQLAQLASDSGSEYLEEILRSGKRASALVEQILAFSRRGDMQHEAVWLSDVVDSALRSLRLTMPANVEIDPSIGADLWVHGDETQIYQVVTNLVTNAVQATGASGGTVRVSLRSEVVDAALASRCLGLRTGPHVCLEVIDEGDGIPAELIGKIFDPFFTTKAEGKGTGLGLSVAYGIVQRHLGAILIENPREGGARFRTYLPCIAWAEGQTPEVDETQGRVLCISDQETERVVVEGLLANRGFTPVIVEGGMIGLEMLRMASTAFDLLVISDGLDEIAAPELARRAGLIRPDLPVLICCDPSDSDLQAVGLPTVRCVHRPVAPAEFVTVLRELEGLRRDGNGAH